MTRDTPDETPPAGHPGPHWRRPRYSGTHPKLPGQRYKELDAAAYPKIHDHVRGQGRTPVGTHVPVLVAEVLAALRPQPGDVVADCTIGFGGHAVEFIKRIGPSGRPLGLDVDPVQLEQTAQRLGVPATPDNGPSDTPPGSDHRQVNLQRSHFAGLGQVLGGRGFDGCDIIFSDLGVSSMQVDDPNRGFSHKYDGPLDMRMGARRARGAAKLLALLSVEELSAALWELADKPDHEGIARCIVRERAIKPITRTRRLVDLVLAAKGPSRRAFRARPTGQAPLGVEGQSPTVRAVQDRRRARFQEPGAERGLRD